MSTRITSHRTVLGKASPAVLTLGERLVSGLGENDTSSESASVRGLNLIGRDSDPTASPKGGENGIGSGIEQFIVIGTDSSIARYVRTVIKIFVMLCVCVCVCKISVYVVVLIFYIPCLRGRKDNLFDSFYVQYLEVRTYVCMYVRMSLCCVVPGRFWIRFFSGPFYVILKYESNRNICDSVMSICSN